jgi:hypothetical protein
MPFHGKWYSFEISRLTLVAPWTEKFRSRLREPIRICATGSGELSTLCARTTISAPLTALRDKLWSLSRALIDFDLTSRASHRYLQQHEGSRPEPWFTPPLALSPSSTCFLLQEPGARGWLAAVPAA